MFHLAFWLVEFGVCIWSDSYLYCGTVVYCCRWVQKTELIWMAGARQARRRGHTRWLRYPELTSLAHFQSINGLEVKIGRNLWKSSSIRFIYFPCYVTNFMLPSLGMWHRVQMAGVLLIRELDFLSSERDRGVTGEVLSAQRGDTVSLLPQRKPRKPEEKKLENQKKKS